ncbi:MAG: hypothetical protein ACD_75C02437G0003 [uncultured bacterium]|nr:MAG: hypothetical protein ACD_75C02437G0003 [uncultured bacterium]
MPNEFSVKIHYYLTEKITEAEKAVAGEDEHSPFYRGQLEELYWIRDYLKENVDLKDFPYATSMRSCRAGCVAPAVKNKKNSPMISAS